MAGTQTEPTRVVTITDAWALPQSDLERKSAWQAMIGALQGNWGAGPWDAGVPGSTGTWHKYSMFWDATCLVNFPGGSTTVVLPFKANNTVITAYPAIPGITTPVSYYLQTGTSFSASLSGPHVLKIHMSKNTK